MIKGMWIKVTDKGTARRVAINLNHVSAVYELSREDEYNGRRVRILLSDGSSIDTYDSFDEIGERLDEINRR